MSGIEDACTLDSSKTYYGVTYGNDRFVCVGADGSSYYSTDGTTWTAMSGLDSSCNYEGVTYGNGRFVCAGKYGIYYSTDGETWTIMTGFDTSKLYYDVIYGKDRFVCVDNKGSSYYSTDGISWNEMSGIERNETSVGITYGNGRFVAVGYYGFYAYCTDGETWCMPKDYTLTQNAIASNDTLAVSVGDGGSSYYTEDGINWNKMEGLPHSENFSFDSIQIVGNKFLSISPSGDIFETTEDKNWIRATEINKHEYIYSGIASSIASSGCSRKPLFKLKSPTVKLLAGDEKVTIKWADPVNVVNGDSILAEWESTVVVRKEGSAPINETDGTVVLVNTEKDKYSNEGYVDTGLTNRTTYYYGIFVKATNGLYTYGCIGKATPVNIVTWADGSWEDIGAMIEAHYNGDIDITDYWSNGDTKRVQLNAISSGTTGESQSAQYIDLTIIDSAHDDLVTSINGVTKAALTIHSKFCLGTKGYMYSGYVGTTYSLWRDSPRRTWCNNEFKNALPAGLVSLIKKVSKVTYRYAHTSYPSYRGSTTTDDEIFLLSEMEVYGTQAMGTESDYGRGEDGTQYEYYKTASNRIKYLDIDGTSTQVWWLRSSFVDSNGNSRFRSVYSSGRVYNDGANGTYGLAPAFCI